MSKCICFTKLKHLIFWNGGSINIARFRQTSSTLCVFCLFYVWIQKVSWTRRWKHGPPQAEFFIHLAPDFGLGAFNGWRCSYTWLLLSYTCNDASMHVSSASFSRPLTLHRQHLVFLFPQKKNTLSFLSYGQLVPVHLVDIDIGMKFTKRIETRFLQTLGMCLPSLSTILTMPAALILTFPMPTMH
jgi:hypothetical protein